MVEESLFLGGYYRHYVRVGDALLMVDGPAPLGPGPVARRSSRPSALKVYPLA